MSDTLSPSKGDSPPDIHAPSLSRLSLTPAGSYTNGRASVSSFTPSLSKIAQTSIIIHVKGRVASNQSRISQLHYSPGGSRLVALSRHQTTAPVANNRRWQHLHIFETVNYARINVATPFGMFEVDPRVLAAEGARAVAFGPETLVDSAKKSSSLSSVGGGGGLFGRKDKNVEKPPVPNVIMLFLLGRQHGDHHFSVLDTDMGQIEIGALKAGSHNHNVPVTEPVAMSPDGSAMIGVSAEDPTEIYVINTPRIVHHNTTVALKVPACIPGHLARVTHLDYRGPDGDSIVSAAADGVLRVTTIAGASPGQCLYRVRVDTRGYPASLLAVSPDGTLVASVWGRQVVRWYPETDVLLAYDLDEVRVVETWPLAFSADCGLLVCRTENGIDLVRVEDGTSAGHLNWTQNGGNYATAAAMTTDGKQMAVGLLNGRIMIHELLYVESQSIDVDVPEEEPPAYSKYGE
ncbi:hypothetical protein PWT90_01601 [Aphanocladium album]|nr:hypothetical protein PWT90_01601 [Aphanocladium album]